MTTSSKLTKLDLALAVKVSNRQEYGEYVTYDALSSDGKTKYTVTLNAEGTATGCGCMSTCGHCKHRLAAEIEWRFDAYWNAPTQQICREAAIAETVADLNPDYPSIPMSKTEAEALVTLEHLIDQDMVAHVEDDIRTGEFVNPLAGLSADERYFRYSTMYSGDYGYSAA